MTALLSVIIPCYNAKDFLRETVSTLNRQTYPAIEIVLVDDGSTDGTGALVDALARESQAGNGFPVRAIHQDNAGPSVARNAGIQAARGPYIGFLDADDRWHPEKAERQIALMDNDPAIGLTSSGWRIITQDGTATKRWGAAPAGVMTLESLLHMNMIATTSTVIARTGLLREMGGFYTGLRHSEDLDLWLRIAARDDVKIVCTGTPLIDRRERPGQLTKQWVKMYEGWLTVLERIRAISPERVGRVERAAMAMNERYCAFLAYEAQDYAGARRLLAQGWRRDPLTLLSTRYTYPTTLAVLATYLPPSLHHVLHKGARALREGKNSR